MKLIDTHSHINSKNFKNDFNEVLDRVKNDLELIINVGYDLKSSIESVNLANKYPFIYATVGIHPHDSEGYNVLVEEELEELCLNNEKVLAIGEIGLDYYRNYSPVEDQKDAFRRQLELARKLNKPVVIHCRDAYKDTIDILNEFKDVKGILHSYAGSYESAKILMDRFYFSFSGPVTFKNATNIKETVTELPLDKILVETDSPYLTPAPFRGKRNEPSYVKYVAEEIARLKGISIEELTKITNENSKKAFNIKE